MSARQSIASSSIFFGLMLLAAACSRQSPGADKGKKEKKNEDPSAARQASQARVEAAKAARHEHLHEGPKAAGVELPPGGHLGSLFRLGDKDKVDLAVLLKNGSSYVGKKVRTQGKVMAQCVRRRGWFAISVGGKRPWLRVITAPAFTIHSTAVGMNAEAEGVIQENTVSEAMAKHLAVQHKLFGGDPAAVKGPQKMYILSATGARFTP